MWTTFWDYEFLRGDGVLVGGQSEVGTSDLPGVPLDVTECVLQLNRDLVAFLATPDVALDLPEGANYERQGSEVGTRLDFTSDPFRSQPYDNTSVAFDVLIEEGSYAGMINAGGSMLHIPGRPVVGVGVARGDATRFDLVVVHVGDDPQITDAAELEILRRSTYLDDLEGSAVDVRRGDDYVVLRFPFTGDPAAWPVMWWVSSWLAEPATV